MNTSVHDLTVDFSDEMFAAAVHMLGVPVCITSDALVARATVTGNRIEALEIALDAHKIIAIMDDEVRFRSLSVQAAWMCYRDSISPSESAAQFNLCRETVSRAYTALGKELQNRFGYKF
jgi:hypothetical protein